MRPRTSIDHERANKTLEADAKAWLDRLLEEGGQLPHDKGVQSFDDVDIDEELLKKGRKYFQNNFFTLIVSMFLGLYSILFYTPIARILALTERSNSKAKSYERYYKTVEHAVSWFLGHYEMKQSLKTVLKLHQAASTKGENARMKLRGREAISGGMTQLDMVVTQWGFIGPALVFTNQLAIHSKKDGDKADGCVYVFYLVGKSLGVLDEFNLCAGSLQQTKLRCQTLLREVIQPSLRKNNQESRDLATHLLEGINVLNPFIHMENFRLFSDRVLLEEKLEIPGHNSLMYTFYLVFFRVLNDMPCSWVLRTFLNNLLRYNFWLAREWFDVILEDVKKEEVEQPTPEMFGGVKAVVKYSVISVSMLAYKEVRARLSGVKHHAGMGCGVLVASCLILWCSAV